MREGAGKGEEATSALGKIPREIEVGAFLRVPTRRRAESIAVEIERERENGEADAAQCKLPGARRGASPRQHGQWRARQIAPYRPRHVPFPRAAPPRCSVAPAYQRDAKPGGRLGPSRAGARGAGAAARAIPKRRAG